MVHPAPVLLTATGWIWFHFGGEIFETCLHITHPEYIAAPAIPGIALKAHGKAPKLEMNQPMRGRIKAELAKLVLTVLNSEGAGRFAEDVPESIWVLLDNELCLSSRFEHWLLSRILVEPCSDSDRANLQQILRLQAQTSY